MPEAIRVVPLRAYPGARDLEIGKTVNGIAIAVSAFSAWSNLESIPKTRIYSEYYIEGDLTPEQQQFQIKAKKGTLVTKSGALGQVVTSSTPIIESLSVTYSHARQEGGLRVALVHEGKNFVCFLHPP